MNTKDKIMEESFKLFLQKGFTDVSLKDIKEASNITTGGFYHYFNSKEDLLIAVIKKYIFDYFNYTLEKVRLIEGLPKDKLKMMALSTLNDSELSGFVVDYKSLHLLLMEGYKKFDIVRDHYTEFFQLMFDFIVDVVDEGVAQGVIRDDMDSKEISRAIQTTVAGNILMGLAMPDIPQKDRLNSTFDNLWEFISK